MDQLENQMEVYKKSAMVQMRAPKVKDKTPNPVQITAEQLIADPEIHQLNSIKMPLQHLVGQDEVMNYKAGKRKEFEEILRRQKFHMGTWVRYAEWEAALLEFRRARSIFERALDVSSTSPSIWMRYIEMEMKYKFIDHARNLFERATSVLPRVDQFWFKYIYMEELLGNYGKARTIFEKWMSWNPPVEAWVSYAAFETRVGEPENARIVMHRFLESNPKIDSYIRVAKYEEKKGSLNEARRVCERALEEIGQDSFHQDFFILWAKLERKAKEIRRARELYEFGMRVVPKESAQKLKEEYLKFQKRFGNETEIDEIVLEKRRVIYRSQLESNPFNYDAWFDLACLEENSDSPIRAREVYEAAVKVVPKISDRHIWKRYMYLAISYSTYEELTMGNFARAKAAMENCSKVLPHKEYSFSKIWILLAKLCIRMDDLTAARSVFGRAIGLNGSPKIFKAYIEIETQMGNFDRCRKLYEKQIELRPEDPESWISYIEMEAGLGEVERAREIYSRALDIVIIRKPEKLWKTAIDFEIDHNDAERVAGLYERLLERSRHVKVFISYALYFFSIEKFDRMRAIFEQADDYLKAQKELKEERALLIENWFQCELKIGDANLIEQVRAKIPSKIKKQRVIKREDSEDPSDFQYEEYYEYVFKDDLSSQRGLNLQRLAHQWKQKDSEEA